MLAAVACAASDETAVSARAGFDCAATVLVAERGEDFAFFPEAPGKMAGRDWRFDGRETGFAFKERDAAAELLTLAAGLGALDALGALDFAATEPDASSGKIGGNAARRLAGPAAFFERDAERFIRQPLWKERTAKHVTLTA